MCINYFFFLLLISIIFHDNYLILKSITNQLLIFVSFIRIDTHQVLLLLNPLLHETLFLSIFGRYSFKIGSYRNRLIDTSLIRNFVSKPFFFMNQILTILQPLLPRGSNGLILFCHQVMQGEKTMAILFHFIRRCRRCNITTLLDYYNALLLLIEEFRVNTALINAMRVSLLLHNLFL